MTTPGTRLTVAAVMLATVACGPSSAERARLEQRARFEPLYRAARAIDGAIDTGVTYQQMGELLQELSAEYLIATDHASGEGDAAIVRGYADVLAAYKDGAAVWKAQLDSGKYDFLGGRITQTDQLAEVATRYQLKVEEIKLAGEPIATLPSDSLQRVWAAAEEKSNKAAKIYLSPAAAGS